MRTYSPAVMRRRNCIEQANSYLDSLLDQENGLKVLLCDDSTRTTLSVVYSQHRLLQHNVVLVDMLANKERFPMEHFSCVVFCGPTESSLACLYQELAEANFSSYSIFFSYFVSSLVVQSLANADRLNRISFVGEVYLDTIPVTEWVCISQLRPAPLRGVLMPRLNPITYAQWDANSFEHMAQSIVGMMLFTNRRPVIRYRANNKAIQKLAEEVAARMKTVHATFPDLKARESVLLILDRMDDPVTPLLMPWTYEAMIHELIGFQSGNEVEIDDVDAKPEERIHVLSASTDAFFEKHRYADWGQVCMALSELVKAYKEMNQFDRKTVSLEEIKNLMSRFPEARKQSMLMTRHCAIATQLLGEINNRNLTRLSVLEQDIVSSSDISEHSRLVMETVQDPKTDVDDALRLVLLYSLRYEKTAGNVMEQLKQQLAQRQCPRLKLNLIDHLLEYGGQNRRAHEIFKTSTGHFFKSVAKAVGHFGQDVQNVATQHTPLLKKLINRLYNGTLAVEGYPVQEVQGSPVSGAHAPYVRGKDIILVIAGGITYTEAMLLWEINQGTVSNSQEALMNMGKAMTRRLTGGETVGPSDELYTAKIEAHVTVLSTALVNSRDFIHSLPS